MHGPVYSASSPHKDVRCSMQSTGNAETRTARRVRWCQNGHARVRRQCPGQPNQANPAGSRITTWRARMQQRCDLRRMNPPIRDVHRHHILNTTVESWGRKRPPARADTWRLWLRTQSARQAGSGLAQLSTSCTKPDVTPPRPRCR